MEEKTIFVNNLEINYKIAGSGPAILILHGWGVSSERWLRVQEILARKGYKVIVPDLPGFGKSQELTKSFDVTNYYNFVLSFVKKIGLNKFSLIGHSFGGGLAAEFAAENPKMVEALILCDAAILRKTRLNFRQKIAQFLAKIGWPILSLPHIEETIYPVAKKIVYKIAGVRDYYLAKGVMRETFKKIISEDLQWCLKGIKIKTLIIWGREDKVTLLEDAYLINKKIRNSKLVILPDIGHAPHSKVPQKLSEIIFNFLQEHGA